MICRALFIAPLRLIFMVAAVVITTTLASFLKPKAALKVASIAGQVVWRAAGVRSVRFIGATALPREAPLVVVNHISWIDFMIMGATTQFAFVMSESVSNAPVVGKGFVKLARHVDSIVLDRGSEDSRIAAKMKIGEKLKNMMTSKSGHQERLLIFPEGTLTNGSCIVPFKLGAFEPLVPVQPLRLEYSNPHYSICDLGTVQGIAFMLCLSGTDVTCTWGPVVSPSADDTPQSLAEKARSALVKGSDMILAKEGGFRDHMALYMSS
jgi:1-acyl-sn-glycerol-3-phosphate acyltransferase